MSNLQTKDMFKTLSSIASKIDESIDFIPLDKLIPFQNHPFQLYDKNRETEMVQSIKSTGVLIPIIVRVHPTKKGCYEILADKPKKNSSSIKLPVSKINQYIDFENKTQDEIQEYIIQALKEYIPPKDY